MFIESQIRNNHAIDRASACMDGQMEIWMDGKTIDGGKDAGDGWNMVG